MKYKVGFIGAGNTGKSFIRCLIESKAIQPNEAIVYDPIDRKRVFIENLGVAWGQNNEDVIENAHVVFLALKPQDFFKSIEPMSSVFSKTQIIASLAPGIDLEDIERVIPHGRIVRVTPVFVPKGVIGYQHDGSDEALGATIEDLLKPLGFVYQVNDAETFDALSVCCTSGPAFIVELMLYWQEWIEERGIDSDVARQMTTLTFWGASQLALDNMNCSLTDLQTRISIKKGGTVAGLESMQELEVERMLRYSFEKAALRIKDLGKKASAPR